MGVATGCGCKEVYRFPHTTYDIPTPLVSVLFCSSIPTFCSFKKNIFSFLYNYARACIANKLLRTGAYLACFLVARKPLAPALKGDLRGSASSK